MQSLVFHNSFALGDTVCISAMIRDVAKQYPQIRMSMAGHYMSYWEACSYVHPLDPKANARVIKLQYLEGIQASKRGEYKNHFLTWFHKFFTDQTSLPLEVTAPKGEIFIPSERQKRLVEGRYWIIISGGKLDATTKWWLPERYQAVVDGLAAYGVPCVQAGAAFSQHIHPPLQRCVTTIGATDDIRDFFSLIKHAEGVICGVTGAMHVAAVFDKPCVVVAGGREEWWWEAYTNHGQFPATCGPVKTPHRFLHTLGMLNCCNPTGCWKNKTVPLNRNDAVNPQQISKQCKDVVQIGNVSTPRCMDMITADHVIEAVMSYYEDNTLPPIGEPKRAYPSLPLSGPPPEVTLTRNVPQRATALPPPPYTGSIDEKPEFAILDNPTIGGKYTLFVLCYGEHFELAKKCFESILATTPSGRLDVRVGLNQTCQKTIDYFKSFSTDIVRKLYFDGGGRKKYPCMRQMFHDPECPIETKYLIWFDDDAVAIDEFWLVRLTEAIISNHREGSRLFGAKFVHDLQMFAKDGHRPDLWFRAAPWWKDCDLRIRHRAATAPNGSCIEFVSGWFWALCTETMRRADIPDARLNHNGGDITIGEQVHQNGGKIKLFNEGKKHIWCPTREQGGRRGYSEPFPWAGPRVTSS